MTSLRKTISKTVLKKERAVAMGSEGGRGSMVTFCVRLPSI